MQGTPHLLAGAALACALKRPGLALPAAFLSHFLLDLTPHLDAHAVWGIPDGGPTRGEVLAATVDGIVGLTLLAILARGHPTPRLVWLGALSGILIDLLNNIPPWGRWFAAWPGTRPLSDFHHTFQINVTPAQWPLGLGTQALVFALAVAYLTRQKRIETPPAAPPAETG